MPRQGRFLEIMVKHMQEFLAPEGINVQSPEIFYKNGVKIGEIDVTLRGNFGSSRIFVGVECRDRPSDGPQGIPWISEIYGKKSLLEVDKMIAVSTTGFTVEAINSAKKLGIDLLTVNNVEDINISNWFVPLVIDFTGTLNEILEVHLSTIPKINLHKNIPTKTLFLFEKDINKLISLEEFIKPELDIILKNYKLNPINELKTVINIQRPIQAIINKKRVSITNTTISLRIWQKIVKTPILFNVYTNPENNEIIAMSGITRIENEDIKFKILATVKKNSTKNDSRDIRLDFLTLDDKPYEIPAGSIFSFYAIPKNTDNSPQI